VVAVGDENGTLHAGAGLDVPALVDHRARTGSIHGFPGAETLPAGDVLTLPVDVLIPAAIGEVIHAGNVDHVSCSLIVEGANHPVTPWADAALADRGVTVIPDILANAGGVMVSYFEWVQNLQQLRWEEDEVNARLAKQLLGAYRRVRSLAGDQGVSLRDAAFGVAVCKVAEAAALRGAI
jgi:glutamate dehydrogenase (NAD(P)+)